MANRRVPKLDSSERVNLSKGILSYLTFSISGVCYLGFVGINDRIYPLQITTGPKNHESRVFYGILGGIPILNHDIRSLNHQWDLDNHHFLNHPPIHQWDLDNHRNVQGIIQKSRF